jgi:hypothetical protein
MNEMFLSPEQTSAHYVTVPQSRITFLPKILIILLALMSVVDGALPQLEMAITGGSVPFAPKLPILLIIGLGSMLLLKGRFQSSTLLPITMVLGGYLILEMFFLHFSKDLSLTSVRRSLEYAILLTIAAAASSVPLQIKARHILAAFIVITLACLVVSAAQFLTDLPVVRTESTDHSFQVQSYQFFGETRAFSLCGTALQAGLFYSFMGGVATSFCLRRGSRRFGLLLLPLCAFGCYATYTRLVMFGFVLSCFAVFAMSRPGLARLMRMFPVVALCCAVLIVVQGLRTSTGAERSLANSSSLDQRLIEWRIYSGKFMGGGPADILFGTGLGAYLPYTVPDRPENAAPVPVDNAYLLILLSMGVTGLALLGIAYWHFWTYLHTRATSSRSHLLLGISGIFATVPFFCFITDPPTPIILLFLLAVSVDKQADVTPVPVLSLGQEACRANEEPAAAGNANPFVGPVNNGFAGGMF